MRWMTWRAMCAKPYHAPQVTTQDSAVTVSPRAVVMRTPLPPPTPPLSLPPAAPPPPKGVIDTTLVRSRTSAPCLTARRWNMATACVACTNP